MTVLLQPLYIRTPSPVRLFYYPRFLHQAPRDIFILLNLRITANHLFQAFYQFLLHLFLRRQKMYIRFLWLQSF